MVGGAPVVGEQQEAERDLGDEQRLCEREQLRDCGARAAVARPERRRRRQHADGDQQECIHMVGR